MRISITKNQLDEINHDLGLSLNPGDCISFNTLTTYDVSLPDILTDKVYYNLIDYYCKFNVDNNTYFDVI